MSGRLLYNWLNRADPFRCTIFLERLLSLATHRLSSSMRKAVSVRLISLAHREHFSVSQSVITVCRCLSTELGSQNRYEKVGGDAVYLYILRPVLFRQHCLRKLKRGSKPDQAGLNLEVMQAVALAYEATGVNSREIRCRVTSRREWLA